MYQAVWKLGKSDFSLIEQIRNEVFVDGFGIKESLEFDNLDAISAHVLVTYEDGDPIATARMFPFDNNTRIGRIAVRERYEGMGYDDLVLRLLLYKAKSLSGKFVTTTAMDFERPLLTKFGFKECGRPFTWCSFSLTPMQLLTSEIDLSGECEHKD
ncbi:MAG: GNAT family N-acetyltransferase [Clostridia bacterium]